MYAKYVANKAHDAIKFLKHNLPQKLLKDCVQRLNATEGFIFTDNKINSYPENSGAKDDLVGIFNELKGTIYIQHNDFGLMNKITSATNDYTVLVHEVGHAFDKLLFNKASSTPKFRTIYEKEKDNLTEAVTPNGYGKQSSHEFFAEVFKAMYSTDLKQKEAVEREAPEAVQYIKNKINSYIS